MGQTSPVTAQTTSSSAYPTKASEATTTQAPSHYSPPPPGILDVDTDELFHADLTTFEGTAQTNALFGSSIITIDEDIIIGAPGQNVNGNTNAGSIYYLNR